MGLLSGSTDSLIRGKGRSRSNASETGEAAGGGGGADGNPNDTSQLDKDEGNVLMSIISQLRPGMDLSKIALPTFVLEPRSLLERITDFFSHPELIFGAGDDPDPKNRFLAVMTYYLSGWHIKPKGVKKPYNPVLGEFFRCSYFYEDGTEGYYIAEQVSHHPPVSAFFYISPKNGLLVTGELKPKSRFLGNSAATIMEGEDRIRLLNKPEDGEYAISMPNTYARGILFGKLILELADLSCISCPKTDYRCDVDFKAKGWISGGYNAIGGHVKGPGRADIGEVSGHWHSVIDYHDKKTGKRSTIFDASKARSAPKTVLPESEQEEYESRRLWAKLTDAIKASDMHGATAAKSAVEDRQREQAKKREAAGEGLPEPRFFKPAEGDKWMPKLDVNSLPKDAVQMEETVRKWIYGDVTPPSKNSPSTPSTSTKQALSSPASSLKGSAPMSGTNASAPVKSQQDPAAQSVSSLASQTSNLSVAEPPAAPTAPGPPAPGPKAGHPIG